LSTKIAFVSLGCDKNLVDTENMLGILNKAGFALIGDESQADVLVLNSCCFIEDAKRESIDNILELANYKTTGNCKALIVTGCMAQRYKEEILAEIPEVDAIIGTTSYDEIATIVSQVLESKGEKVRHFNDIDRKMDHETPRILTTAGYYAFLKIAEGCDNHCTYCIIPQLRGKYRSREMESLIKEAKGLVAQGVSELILVAQDTTRYGIDLYGKKKLPQLLHELGKIDGLEWIRILYCYPEEITDELIMAIKNEPKVCKYIDMPIQHADNEILKQMGRKSSREQLEEVIAKMRHEIPAISLRTTLIVGFPGETNQQFNNLVSFVEKTKFDRLGVFTYSKEEDTPAAKLPNQIDQAIMDERKNLIMSLQQEISNEKTKEMIGKTTKVLIEGKLTDEAVYIGRTYKDAPDIDGQVFVTYEGELLSGDMIDVKILNAYEYDLIGVIDDEPSK